MANSPARSVIDVGSVIAGTYTIEALIGRGGMGSVYVASHTRLAGKKVAIKLLHAELHDEEVHARFKREADIASRLGHPNIVTVHDHNVTEDGTPYLVLEYLEGESLAQRLKAGPMQIEQITSIVRQVGSALAAAHREGIVHRDLKPQNIFLVPTEVDGRMVEIAKVLDFGISKIRGSQTVKTLESSLLGTPQYMAPEQATGQHDKVEERTDVFALGAIIYEMVCGQPAFQGENIPEVVFKVVYEEPAPLPPGVPPAIAAAIKRAMAKAQDARFPTVGDLVEAITGQPVAPLTRGSRASLTPGAVPLVGAGTGRKINTGREAFDNTIGSGDHTEPPVPAIAAPAAPRSVVRGSSPTIDSQARVKTPPPRRSHALVIGIAIACVTATAVIMYVAMRRPERTARTPVIDPATEVDEVRPRPAHPHVATSAGAANHTPAPPAPPPTTMAPPTPKPPTPPRSPATGEHAPTPAKPPTTDEGAAKPAKPPKPRPGDTAVAPPPSPPVAADEDAETRDRLHSSEQALAAGNYEVAERLANAVMNSEGARPKQLAQARAIHGMVACLAHNNAEVAQADLRTLGHNPVLRKRVISACQRAGTMQAAP